MEAAEVNIHLECVAISGIAQLEACISASSQNWKVPVPLSVQSSLASVSRHCFVGFHDDFLPNAGFLSYSINPPLYGGLEDPISDVCFNIPLLYINCIIEDTVGN